ncbi:hypothetical protein NM688_g2364 [Phlebia brevispora]|uniref:Uncharacterized protein n=1 Tax=Phlebia brevispora TaxID=194682 RepID=A0ACC1T8W8_9APHY|nr:hypothetical protein NM688_g2364 [Phlebia brevispora]
MASRLSPGPRCSQGLRGGRGRLPPRQSIRHETWGSVGTTDVKSRALPPGSDPGHLPPSDFHEFHKDLSKRYPSPDHLRSSHTLPLNADYSEELKIAIEATAASDQGGPSSNTPGGYETLHEQPTDAADEEKKRIVAIVTHVDSSTGDEQGCAFILRPRRQNAPEDAFKVDHVFPIVAGFGIGMAQSRRNTLNLSVSEALSQPRVDLTLTIHPGHDPLMEPVYMVTHDIQKLRVLLAECKRLKDTAVASSEPGIIPPYPWIMPYISKSRPEILSAIPTDLRHAHRSIYELLSKAYAGSPGDDRVDISVVREEWIRSKIREVYISSQHATSLKLRVGTFNVNGKLPSQDLSGWIRKFVNRKKYIPSLYALSPLSLGEVVKDDLHDANVSRLDISDPEGEDAKAVPSSLGVPSASATSLLPGDEDEDPDMIVLAFQELDLSAGALLYSTETTREDAWFTAAMAGLGEKAELYTKVRVGRCAVSSASCVCPLAGCGLANICLERDRGAFYASASDLDRSRDIGPHG